MRDPQRMVSADSTKPADPSDVQMPMNNATRAFTGVTFLESLSIDAYRKSQVRRS